jgi:hypothetical protein
MEAGRLVQQSQSRADPVSVFGFSRAVNSALSAKIAPCYWLNSSQIGLVDTATHRNGHDYHFDSVMLDFSRLFDPATHAVAMARPATDLA